MVGGIATVHATESPEVSRGLGWLTAQVSADGSLGGEQGSVANARQSAAETLLTLATFNAASPVLVHRVSVDSDASTEVLARSAIALVRSGQQPANFIADLRARQNADGGFGDVAAARSNSLDTAWTLLAFHVSGFGEAASLKAALDYLVSSAQADGGFSTPDSRGSLFATAYALQALAAYRDAYASGTYVARAVDWMKSARGGDSGYGQTLYDALATLAFAANTADSTQYADLVAALKAAQAEDGSWQHDPFLTSLALRALGGKVSPPPSVQGRVTGQVVDAGSRTPLKDASVSVNGLGVLTDQNGRFQTGGLGSGAQTLAIARAGYAPRQLQVSLSVGTTTDAGIIALDVPANVAVLRGTATDGRTGQVLAAATLRIEVGGQQHSALSSANGAYEIVSVPAGQGTVVAEKTGYRSLSTSLNVLGGTSYSFSPALYPEGAESPTLATLQGRIIAADTSTPISGATISVGEAHTSAAADGSFTLRDLPPGDSQIRVIASGYLDASFSGVLSVGVNKAGDLRLQPSSSQGRIKGKVVDAATRAPLEGASIRVSGSSLSADQNGQFEIGVSAGSHTLMVSRAGYSSAQLQLSVSGGGLADIGSIALAVQSDRALVRGVVVDGGSGQPLAAVTVAATVDGISLSSLTSANGGFELSGISAGAGSIVAQKTGYRTAAAAVNFAAGGSYNFSPALYAEEEEVPTKATLSGRIVAADTDAAIGGAEVTIAGRSASSSAEGSFSLDQLDPGSVSIAVQASGYDAASFTGMLSAGINRIGDLRLQRTATSLTLFGDVIDAASGAGVAGAVVRVQGTDFLAVTNARGVYRIEGLPEKHLNVVIEGSGYYSQTYAVNAPSFGNVEVDFPLTRAEDKGIRLSAATDLAAYDPFSDVKIAVTARNERAQDQQLVFTARIYDSERRLVETVPFKLLVLGQQAADAAYLVPASASVDLGSKWYNQVAVEGDYSIVVSAAALSGEVLAEASTGVTIRPKTMIGGGLTVNPPVTQAGTQESVSLSALVGNRGNLPYPGGSARLSIVLDTPDTSASLPATAAVTQLAAGTPLVQPGPAVSDALGNLYLINLGNRAVIKVTPSGQAQTLVTFPASVTLVDLTLVSDGSLRVIAGTGAIYKVIAGVIAPGSTPSGLAAVTAITADANDNLYATGSVGIYDTLMRIAPDGQRTEMLRRGFLGAPGAAKGADGRFYVPNFHENSMLRVDSSGRTEVFLAAGLSRPTGIVAAPGGGFLVSDSNASRVVRVSATGAITNLATGISSPQGLVLSPSGDLLVTSAGSSSIERVSPTGAVTRFSQSFSAQPGGITYDSAGQLYVAGTDGSLRRRNADGLIESLLPSGRLGPAVADIFAGNGGELYAVNGASTVLRYLPGSTTASVFGSGLVNASSVSMDNTGQLLVAETSGNRISRISSSGVRETLAQPLISSAVGMVAAADGTRYILNTSNIARIPATGRASVLVSSLAGTGYDIALRNGGGAYALVDRTKLMQMSLTGGFSLRVTVPASRRLAVASDNTAFLVDDTSNKIHRVKVNNTIETFATTASRIRDIDVDGAGGLIVATEDGKIQRFASNGTPTAWTSVDDVVALSYFSDGSAYVLIGSGSFIRIEGSGQKTTLLSGIGNGHAFARTASGAFDILDNSAALLRQYDAAGQLQRTVAGFGAPVDVEWLDGEIVFADSSFGRVYSMSADSGLPRLYAGVRVDRLHAANGKLYGSISGAGRIVTIAADGNLSDRHASAELAGMNGFAVRGDELAIIEAAQNRVATIGIDGATTASYVALAAPAGIAIDSQGQVYVANSNGIVRFSPDGRQSELIPLDAPKALTIGPDGVLWASSDRSVLRHEDGRFLPVASGPDTISGLMFDGSQLYATDTVALRRLAGDKLEYFAGGIRQVRAMRFGADGLLYMASSSPYGMISRYDGREVSLVAGGFSPLQALVYRSDGLFVSEVSSLYQVDLLTGEAVDQQINLFTANATIKGLASGAGGRLMAVVPAQSAIYQIEPGLPSTPPAAGTEMHNVQVQLDPIAVSGAPLEIDLGSWVPTYAGEYSVHLTPSDGTAGGSLVGSLHVGPHATGTLTTDRNHVQPGDAALRLTASVSGADFTTLSKADPSNLRHLFGNPRPVAMGADPAGNIYLADATTIRRVRPDGVTEIVFTTAAGLDGMTMYGGLPVDPQGKLYVANGRNQVLRVVPNGGAEVLATLTGSVRSMVIDSRNQVIAAQSNGQIYRIGDDGQAVRINVPGVTSVYAITIDGLDNLYIFRAGNTAVKVSPVTGAVSLVPTADARFEYEGMPVAGDCADNLLLAPFHWPEMGQESTEEHTLIQIPARGGLPAKIFDGFSVNPRLDDLDFIVYDRYGQGLLMWTDNFNRISRMPISCGAISTDLHLVTQPGQTASGFSLAPSSVTPGDDGSAEYVWSLKDVTALGQAVQFDTVLPGMKLGEERAVAREAYLLFNNSFTGGTVKLPLKLPTVRTGGMVSLSVATDRASYPANTDVVIDLGVNNPNASAVQGRLRLDLFDPQGAPLATLMDEEQSLDAGSLAVLHPPFSSGSHAVGSYTLKAQFTDGSGYLQAEASAKFGIVASGSDTGTEASVKVAPSTDKTLYGEFDTVQLLARARSYAANYAYEDLTQVLTVFDPNGAQVFSESRAIRQLLPNGSFEQRGSYKLPGSLLGVFGVHVAVIDRYGSVIAAGSTSFEARGDDSLTLTGSVLASRKVVPLSESQTCRDTVVNGGQRDLVQLPLRQSIVELAGDRIVSTTTQTQDLLAGGQVQLTRVFSTEGYALGQHACVLEAEVGGKWKALGYDVFSVDPPPVRVTAKLELGKKGRILILLDGAPPTGSQKAEPAPELQRSFLEKLLDREGWAYTIVTNADAFAWELRSGGYNTYALFSESTKLDERVQKELREAVYRGEGLLEAGAHDQRHHGFDDALGLKYLGKLAGVTGVEVLAAEPGPAGYADIALRDKPLRAQLGAAASLGRYLGGKSSDPSAVAARSYGRGRSLYFGYDLLAEAVLAGDAGFHARQLVQGLAHVQPAYASEALAGRVVPLRLTLHNEGNATAGQLRLPMPDGAVIVDRGTATVQGGVLVWNYQLEANGEKVLVAWVRLPLSAGQLTFTAEVFTGPASQLVPQGTASLSLRVIATGGLAEARQLAASAAEFKQVRNWLDKADAALSANDADSALTQLVKASDELLKVSHAAAGDLRLMIDQALLDAGRLYWGG
ncbi:MAG TPA: carboxypeptidase regulatory-like domain-containing protein [Solimonas sp.]|nr:carboxypeptidase regulatory-like domain-containing protein [Solimonas sp.]